MFLCKANIDLKCFLNHIKGGKCAHFSPHLRNSASCDWPCDLSDKILGAVCEECKEDGTKAISM
jgi:hypothetical protein